ncbi:MAG: YwaF family protein [Firmicutes bacterium]|nr:YwaF family protein [Bacillota bacterium]MBR3788170.1 YwaF family protein [Bacillota bacterium]
MFSIYHIIWLVICVAVMIAAIIYLKKQRPQLKDVLTVACIVSIASELIKVFSTIQMVPSSDGTMMYPYLEVQHLPLHLCSLQILVIFYVRFSNNDKLRDKLLAFMYPTCIVGAVLALMMTSIFNATIEVTQAFTHPLAYQYFLFHTMLLLLGIYIPMSGEVELDWKHYRSTMAILAVLGFLSIYINSLLAKATYVSGVLQSVDYTPNFFFTYKFPIGIVFTEIWHWYIYIAVIAVAAAAVIGLMYLPFCRKKN